MAKLREDYALWGSIFGSTVALLGIALPQTWLAFLGVSLATASAVAGLHLTKLHAPTPISIEGFSLDALHIANLRRRRNRSLLLERAFQIAIVNGSDLTLAWQYNGKCKTAGETNIEFSIDSENNIAFDQLDCYAVDLLNDPGRERPIRPTLVGSDGVSKKIRVPFHHPLSQGDSFSILLRCTLPGCVTTGTQYYVSSLSFDQPSIESAVVQLIFPSEKPAQVKVLDYNPQKGLQYIRTLRPFRDDGTTCEYVDMEHSVPGQWIRVYLYTLDPH